MSNNILHFSDPQKCYVITLNYRLDSLVLVIMNHTYLLFSLFLLIILGFTIFFCFLDNNNAKKPELFVGISVAHYNLEEIIGIVDEIESYTNLFVVGSTGITYDLTRLDSVCTYLFEKGLYFMIYMHPTEEISSLEI